MTPARFFLWPPKTLTGPIQERFVAVKIVVCIKQVPARDSGLRLNASATWVQETDLSFEVNEPDIYALEEALRLKEKHGGEVVLATLGPARATHIWFTQVSGRMVELLREICASGIIMQ